MFDAFAQWKAAQTKAYVAVVEGIYLGPVNASAVEKIAKATHPDRF